MNVCLSCIYIGKNYSYVSKETSYYKHIAIVNSACIGVNCTPSDATI
jgi:hypothetical protein